MLRKLALTTTLVVALSSSAAVALAQSTPERSSSNFKVATLAGGYRVEGLVTDGLGHRMDDVQVVARNSKGRAAASALSYASVKPNKPQHGYFFLELPAGKYTVKLSKSGYQSVTLSSVRVTDRGFTLKPVKLLALTTVKASNTAVHGKKASVPVRVVTKRGVPTGKVSAYLPGARKAADTERLSRGKATLHLTGLPASAKAVVLKFQSGSYAGDSAKVKLTR